MNFNFLLTQALFPLLVVTLGYFLCKCKLLKTQRVILYLLVLFMSFVLDLTGVSFQNDLFNVFLYFSALTIIAEIIWRIYLSNKKNLFKRLAATLLSSYIILNILWLIFSPAPKSRISAEQIDTYTFNNKTYTLKKRVSRKIIGYPRHVVTLNRVVPSTPFEKQIDKYVTAEGYFFSEYSFNWGSDSRNVWVDLIGDKDTLWTLSEKTEQP
ncbi:hypothetical protein CHISP_2682 [Chitinispirillum alkaliphilum]|nr:hypothetical protein CHISP_2682 [Chitinispirillum alkaliphilum]